MLGRGVITLVILHNKSPTYPWFRRLLPLCDDENSCVDVQELTTVSLLCPFFYLVGTCCLSSC